MFTQEHGEMLARVDERTLAIKNSVSDHELRLRAVERFRWITMGVIILAVTGGGWYFT